MRETIEEGRATGFSGLIFLAWMSLGIPLISGCSSSEGATLGDFKRCQEAYCAQMLAYLREPIEWHLVLDVSKSYSRPSQPDAAIARVLAILKQVPVAEGDSLCLGTFALEYRDLGCAQSVEASRWPFVASEDSTLIAKLRSEITRSTEARRWTDFSTSLSQLPGPELGRRRYFILVTDGKHEPRGTESAQDLFRRDPSDFLTVVREFSVNACQGAEGTGHLHRGLLFVIDTSEQRLDYAPVREDWRLGQAQLEAATEAPWPGEDPEAIPEVVFWSLRGDRSPPLEGILRRQVDRIRGVYPCLANRPGTRSPGSLGWPSSAIADFTPTCSFWKDGGLRFKPTPAMSLARNEVHLPIEFLMLGPATRPFTVTLTSQNGLGEKIDGGSEGEKVERGPRPSRPPRNAGRRPGPADVKTIGSVEIPPERHSTSMVAVRPTRVRSGSEPIGPERGLGRELPSTIERMAGDIGAPPDRWTIDRVPVPLRVDGDLLNGQELPVIASVAFRDDLAGDGFLKMELLPGGYFWGAEVLAARSGRLLLFLSLLCLMLSLLCLLLASRRTPWLRLTSMQGSPPHLSRKKDAPFHPLRSNGLRFRIKLRESGEPEVDYVWKSRPHGPPKLPEDKDTPRFFLDVIHLGFLPYFLIWRGLEDDHPCFANDEEALPGDETRSHRRGIKEFCGAQEARGELMVPRHGWQITSLGFRQGWVEHSWLQPLKVEWSEGRTAELFANLDERIGSFFLRKVSSVLYLLATVCATVAVYQLLVKRNTAIEILESVGWVVKLSVVLGIVMLLGSLIGRIRKSKASLGGLFRQLYSVWFWWMFLGGWVLLFSPNRLVTVVLFGVLGILSAVPILMLPYWVEKRVQDQRSFDVPQIVLDTLPVIAPMVGQS